MLLSLMRSIVFFLCALLVTPVFAADKTILIMGDSLSAGYGIAQSEAWPVLLAQRLKQQRLPYTVVNASISGETSAGGRSRIAAELARNKPAIVIIELGANDGLRGLSIRQMHDNLDHMITAAQGSGAKVMLIGMQMPPNFGQGYTQKFQETFTSLAKARKTTLLPFLMDGFAEKRDMFLADGIHPVAAAQARILDNVWPVLKPLLK